MDGISVTRLNMVIYYENGYELNANSQLDSSPDIHNGEHYNWGLEGRFCGECAVLTRGHKTIGS